jgi:hypothetical protein
MAGPKRVKGSGGQVDPLIVHAPDMTQLWEGLNDSILWATKEELAYYSSLDCMIGDVIGMADTATFDINIGADLWVTESRWNTLTRQYLDPERLFKWLESIKEISTYNRGITAMDMQSVKHTVVESNRRASRRKHGGCMRMVTYRAFPQPTVALYSRTSYLGYIGGLDMLLANKLIEQASDMIGDGLKVSDFRFRWHIEVAQLHGFKSLAYMFSTGQDKFMRVSEQNWPTGKRFKGRVILPLDDYPTWKLIRNWWARIQKQDREGKLYSEMKYGAEKRIRRRYHSQTGVDQTPFLLNGEKVYKPLSFPIELVNLDRMLYKTPESRAIMRKKRIESSKALVDQLFNADNGSDLTWLDELDIMEV